MELVKTVHILSAALSIVGFFVRGLWMLNGSPMLQRRWVKISPHVIDTVLLVSAITLAVMLSLSPLGSTWLLAKIIALIAYIGLGVVALRAGKTLGVRAVAWCAALVVFAYIVSVAYTKTPLGFLAALVGT